MQINWGIRKFGVQQKHNSFWLSIEICNLNISTKVVHLKPSDKIWDYQEFFRGSYLDGTDFHFSWTKDAKLVWRNKETKIYAFVSCKSIQWNLDANEEQYAGSMIKVRKWNQMVIEFENLSSICKILELIKKFNVIRTKLNLNETCIFVDEDYINKIWRKTENKNIWTSYKNLEYYKTELSDASNDAVLKEFETLENKLKLLKVNLKFILQSRNWMLQSQTNFAYFDNFIVENLVIKFDGYFDSDTIWSILKSIGDIKRIKAIKFEVNDKRILKALGFYIHKFDFRPILTIDSNVKIDAFDKFILAWIEYNFVIQ